VIFKKKKMLANSPPFEIKVYNSKTPDTGGSAPRASQIGSFFLADQRYIIVATLERRFNF
jgi:hypothetical protein